MTWYLSFALDVYEVPFPPGQRELEVMLVLDWLGVGPSNPGRILKD